MAQGEVVFDKAAVKRDRTPLAAGKWKFKIRGDKAEIARSKDKNPQDAIPYIKVPLEALDSAPKDGGGNKWVFHNLFLVTDPRADGTVAVFMADGFQGLANALGDHPSISTVQQVVTDEKTQQPKTVTYLDPRAVEAWVKNHNGEVVEAVTRVEYGKKDKDGKQQFGDKAVVDLFVELEAASEDGPGTEPSDTEEPGDLEDDFEEPKPVQPAKGKASTAKPAQAQKAAVAGKRR